MKLLLCQWAELMHHDVCEGFRNLGIELDIQPYDFKDCEAPDDVFHNQFTQILKSNAYDAVFSINYIALLAKVCHEQHTPYISWVFDSPFDVRHPEETLGFPTNHVFFFDKDEYTHYQKLGYKTVHHMELATNYQRLDALLSSATDLDDYACDVSFVGKLYQYEFPMFYRELQAFEKGYFDALIDVQSRLYGAYILKDCLSESLMSTVKKYFETAPAISSADLDIFTKWVNNLTASEITRRERLLILISLAKRCKVHLYTYDHEDILDASNVHIKPAVHPLTEAPKIFRASKINLQITLKETTSGISLRVFDILGAGGFLLANWQKEIAENFIDGEEVVLYTSIEDAVEKALYYLKHEEERMRIAQNGRKAVTRFSFERQLQKILDIVFANT